jgi:CheY-like chemotaxis protein
VQTPLDVLIVEDEPVVREAAYRISHGQDLVVATANDVSEAIARLEDISCRLVLTDLMLPGASGFDLLDLIRKRWPATEVVIITGYATLDNALASFQKGAFDFVPKPFDVGELLGVMMRALHFSARTPKPRGALPGDDSTATKHGAEEPYYFLGRHSWARLQADGSATLGVAETFPQLIGETERIELPAAQEHSIQGKLLARILTPGEILYRVWSPLSGIILTSNLRLHESTDLIDRDPFGEGWLIRIVPDNLDGELDLLELRQPT